MSNSIEKISHLPPADRAFLDDILPVAQGSTGPDTGVTRKITGQQLVNLVGVGGIGSAPTFSFPSITDGTHSASISLSFPTTAAMSVFNPAAMLSGAQIVATVAGYNAAGDNGGGIFDLLQTSRAADNVIVFAVASQSAYKWVRRYDPSSLTFEMAGAIGDYSFATDTGTDNAAAITAFCAAFNQAAFTAGRIGTAGIRVQLRAGCAYLVRSIPTLCGYLHICGTGHNYHNWGANFPQWLAAGSSIVLDVANGATSIKPAGDSLFENFMIARRGLPINPTGSQCIAAYGSSAGSWNDGSIAVLASSANHGFVGAARSGSGITLRKLTLFGFGTGVVSQETNVNIYDCLIDCYHGTETTDQGDTTYRHRNKIQPLMALAVPGTDPDIATCKFHAGIGLNYHDRCDTLDSDGEQVEKWSTGVQFQNVGTAPSCHNLKIECTNRVGDIGINCIGFISQLTILNPYVANAPTPINIQAVQYNFATRQSWFTEGSSGTPSRLDIVGGIIVCPTGGIAVIVIGGDYCITRIWGQDLYPNGCDLLHVAAVVAGRAGAPKILLDMVTVSQPTVGVISIDPTMIANTFIGRIQSPRSSSGTWYSPPGGIGDAEVIVPNSGNSKTLSSGFAWHQLRPANALAALTLTMPAAPQNGGVCEITTTQSITTLTMLANTGQTLNAPAPALAADAMVSWRYDAPTATWVRLT